MTVVFYAVRNWKTGAYLSPEGDSTCDLNEMYTPQTEAEAKKYRLTTREPEKYVVVKFELTWPDAKWKAEPSLSKESP